MESELRFGTGASPALLVDVEGCLRVGGSFSDELGSAIERWLELAALSNEEFVVVVWSSEAESAREGARWLGQRLHRRVVGIEKSGLSLGRVRPSDVVVDDDDSWLALVSALGPTGLTPGGFIEAAAQARAVPALRQSSTRNEVALAADIAPRRAECR